MPESRAFSLAEEIRYKILEETFAFADSVRFYINQGNLQNSSSILNVFQLKYSNYPAAKYRIEILQKELELAESKIRSLPCDFGTLREIYR